MNRVASLMTLAAVFALAACDAPTAPDESVDISPSFAKAVTFTDNASNAGKNSTATFSAEGTYQLEVVVMDLKGRTANAAVTETRCPCRPAGR